MIASRPWRASNGLILSVELFESRNAPRAVSSILSSDSGFSSRANVRTEFYRLRIVCSTHPVARCSFTKFCLIFSIPSLLQSFQFLRHKLVP